MSVTDPTDIILKQINNIPPLPLAAQKLLEVMQDEKSSAEDVTEVLLTDQSLVAKVLKLVNSPFYGMQGKITTISRAVVVLGFTAVRNLALGMGTIQSLKSIGGQVDMTTFWEHSIATAAAAQALAPHANYPDPEEAFIAGLMHDIGHFVLALALPEEYAEAHAAPGDQRANERALLGMAHTRAGKLLMKEWQLPKMLSDVATFHHTQKIVRGGEDPLITLCALADMVATTHGGGVDPAPSSEDLDAAAKVVGVSIAELHAVMAEMDERIDQTRVFMQLAEEGVEPESPPAAERGASAGRAENSATAGDTTGSRPSLQVVVIGGSPDRVSWVQGLLTRFGHGVVPMKAFLGKGSEAQQADLVLVDVQSMTHPQIAKVGKILENSSSRVAVVKPDQPAPEHGIMLERYPGLPYAFSDADLVSVMGSTGIPA